jgi:hypothetical protein
MELPMFSNIYCSLEFPENVEDEKNLLVQILAKNLLYVIMMMLLHIIM